MFGLNYLNSVDALTNLTRTHGKTAVSPSLNLIADVGFHSIASALFSHPRSKEAFRKTMHDEAQKWRHPTLDSRRNGCLRGG